MPHFALISAWLLSYNLLFIVTVCKLWPKCFWIQGFIRTHPYIFFTYCLWLFLCYNGHSLVVSRETIWLTKLKICTLWPFLEKGCLLLSKSFDDHLQTEITSVSMTERKASIFLLSLLYTERVMGLIRKHISYIKYLLEGVYGREGREKNVRFLRRTFNDLPYLIFFQRT